MDRRFLALQDEIMAHFPFVDGFVDVKIDGIKLSTARKVIERMFKGAGSHYSPQKWDNALSDRICKISQIDNNTLRVLIRKR